MDSPPNVGQLLQSALAGSKLHDKRETRRSEASAEVSDASVVSEPVAAGGRTESLGLVDDSPVQAATRRSPAVNRSKTTRQS